MTARQSTLAHEAAHVVGGLLAGHRIGTVRLGATKRAPKNAATTTFDFAECDTDFFGHLVAVLMGPMAEGKPPPAWPPLPDLEGNDDEHVAAALVSHLKLSKADYQAAVALAAHWLDDPQVKAAIASVGHALGELGVLTDQTVREVVGPSQIRRLALAELPRQGEPCST